MRKLTPDGVFDRELKISLQKRKDALHPRDILPISNSYLVVLQLSIESCACCLHIWTKEQMTNTKG